MTRTYLILTAAVAALFLAACQPKPPEPTGEGAAPPPEAALPAPEAAPADPAAPAEGETALVEVNRDGHCPVMTGNKVNHKVFADHEGKRYYFCCKGCPEKFSADPEKYIAKLKSGEAAEGTPMEQMPAGESHGG